jgi:hypothetical protein
MTPEGKFVMQYEGGPGPWDDGIKLMSFHEGTPQTFQE